MFRMIVSALLRTHEQIRNIAIYFILNQYHNAIEQTMLIAFIVFKWLTKNI